MKINKGTEVRKLLYSVFAISMAVATSMPVYGRISRPENLSLASLNMQLNGWPGGSNKSWIIKSEVDLVEGVKPGAVTGEIANLVDEMPNLSNAGYRVDSPEFASVIVKLKTQQKVRYVAVSPSAELWTDSQRLLDSSIMIRDSNGVIVYDSAAKSANVLFVAGKDPVNADDATAVPSWFIFDLKGTYDAKEIEFGDNGLAIQEIEAYSNEQGRLAELQALEMHGWNGGLVSGLISTNTVDITNLSGDATPDSSTDLVTLVNGVADIGAGFQSATDARIRIDFKDPEGRAIRYIAVSPRSGSWGTLANLAEVSASVRGTDGHISFSTADHPFSRYYVRGSATKPSYLILDMGQSLVASAVEIGADYLDLQEVDAYPQLPPLEQFSRPGLAFYEYPMPSGGEWPELGSLAINKGVTSTFTTDAHINSSSYMLRFQSRFWVTESSTYRFMFGPNGKTRFLLDGMVQEYSTVDNKDTSIQLLEPGMHEITVDFKASSEADELEVLIARDGQEPVRLDTKNLFLPEGFEALNIDSGRLPLKVGIVYSPATELAYGDAFQVRQIYAACQLQSVMAGVPFDLIEPAELLNYSSMTNRFGALIIPSLDGFTPKDSRVVATNLQKLMTLDGVGIVASSDLFSYNAQGVFVENQSTPLMEQIFKIRPRFWGDNLPSTVSIPGPDENGATHPILKLYGESGQILDYKGMWFTEFEPIENASADVIATIEAGGNTYNGILTGTRGTGKFVHFSNMDLMMDTRMIWASLRWVFSQDAHGSPIHLSPTRENGLFLARNDMDLSRFFFALNQTEFPLLEFLKDWKAKYNFVGSYYINNGNNPAAGEFTDWSVSKPLYDDYIALGNEIGTHSYTHPQRTADLDANTLRFEFEQSKIEIEAGLGNTVYGTAIPGEDETLFVVDELKKYLDYISGHGFYSQSDRYQNPSIGYLTPADDLLYFSLNMTPDYVLGDVMMLPPEQSIQFWKDEMASAVRGMPKGVLQFLWHDYAVTTAVASGKYSVAMIEETIREAYQRGYEFLTLEDFMFRFRAARNNSVNYFWTDTDSLTVQVNGDGLGQYAMELSENLTIGSVANWYAYDDDTVFVPESGGIFEISMSTSPDAVTRISKLPMRMKLRNTTGDGENLTFDVNGEGVVEVTLNTSLGQKYQVMGIRDFDYTETGLIRMNLQPSGEHRIQIQKTDNILPLVSDISIAGDWEVTLPFDVQARDFDGTVESIIITRQPAHGTIQMSGFSGSYTSQPGFTGVDTFEFVVVDDKGAQSLPALGTASISPTNLSDGLNYYNPMNREFVLDGSFDEWESLEPALIDPVDASGTNDRLDFRQISLAHNSEQFLISYVSERPAPLNWAHNIYIDTDANPGTGYQYWHVGADLLIQAGKAYQYLGTGTEWSWQALTTAKIATAADNTRFEISVDMDSIGATDYLQMVFLADNFAYSGSTFDFAPDGFTTAAEKIEYYFIDPNGNFAPSATPDSAVILKDSARQFTLKGVDRESASLSYSISRQPVHGVLDGLPPDITYTPDPGFIGEDYFEFVVSDGELSSSPARVSIRVVEFPSDGIYSNDGSMVFLDGNMSEWKTLTPLPSDSVESPEPPAGHDWNTAYLAHDTSSLFVAISNNAPITLNWGLMMFIDSDRNPSTGFKLGAAPDYGFDVMVQGSGIFSYTGTGLDWAWNFVAFTDRGVKDNVIEFRVPLSSLGIASIPAQVDILFYADNSAFAGGTFIDLYPDAGSSTGDVWTYEFRNFPASQNTGDIPVQIAPSYNHVLTVYEKSPQALTSSMDEGEEPLVFKLRFEAEPRSKWNLRKSTDLRTWSGIHSWTVYGANAEVILPPDFFDDEASHFFLEGSAADDSRPAGF